LWSETPDESPARRHKRHEQAENRVFRRRDPHKQAIGLFMETLNNEVNPLLSG
jgi:hypothetical protein